MTIDVGSLVERIAGDAERTFGEDRLGQLLGSQPFYRTTEVIKKFFGDLGRDLNFKVAASGYTPADEGEWLYDMVWYCLDREEGMLTRLPMILESEWNPVAADSDFQKLVQARAEVRVWMFAAPTKDIRQKHFDHCKKQATAFPGAQRSDNYVLIGFDWTTKQTVVEKFRPDAL